ncbi:hypothetical protein ANCCAN_24886 [Ancylostoma caninum]|uniref:Uncharacterized protein n=1 Tax=Ancylostoma caninum TaxID=29170 RepID=A0A368FCM1_ANCCA|nr:hypothetical protein ANCCAN_24886 [Ancylostoma caninum]
MVRGCFCDCFGPLTRARASSIYDKPLDPEDVNKCLQRYRAYEARQEMRANEQNRPLIATISDSCAAPYDTAVLPSAPPIQVCFLLIISIVTWDRAFFGEFSSAAPTCYKKKH